jgi:hypothetical protein
LSSISVNLGQIMRATSFLPFILLLPLAACGGGDAPPATPAASTAAVAPAAPTKPAAPAKVDDLKPLFGTWALDLSQCGGQVLKISAAKFEGPGSSCDISGFTDNGNGSYTAAVNCTSSGQTSSERISMRPIFAPTGEGIDLVYLDRKNLASEILRCPAG